MAVSSGFEDFNHLAATLDSAGPKALRNVRKALMVSAMKAKDFWQEDADRGGLSNYAKSVDFDIETSKSGGGAAIEVVLGPNLDRRQGMFGLVEEARGGVKSAPQFSGRAAIESVQDDLEEGLMKALEDAAKGD